MTSPLEPQPAPGRLAGAPPAPQWALLAVLSLLLASGLQVAGFPGALLIGPMLAGVIMGGLGTTVRLPQKAFSWAQTIVGCMIANSLSPGLFPAFLADWPMFFGVTVATLLASSLLGWLISRWRILPGTVGVWGSAPGASSAMVLMAGSFGADQRLVAFMQYLRVVIVTGVAAAIAHWWVGASGAALPPVVWFPPVDPVALASTFAVAIAGALAARAIRLPTPYFLGPMILGVALRFSGLVEFQLPPWLLAASYALIGWAIGLRFTRQTILAVRRALPQVTLSIFALILFCGALGALLWAFAGVDPLTAYLATSPGGMDAVAIIAAASHNVDISFIMVMQMMRFIIVLLFGPMLARLVAGWVKP